MTGRHDGRARPAVAALAVAAAVLLTGCSGGGGGRNPVGQAAEAATCDLAQQAVEGAARGAEDAVADLGTDPAQAKSDLEALRDSLVVTEESAPDETQDGLDDAVDALDDLIAEAEQAADGSVDQGDVDDAEQDLRDAADELTTVC